MARRPNYKFERMERDRAKAAKKATKKAARAKAKEGKAQTEDPDSNHEIETDDDGIPG